MKEEKKNLFINSPSSKYERKSKYEGSIKKYTGRYCEYCFAEFQGKAATKYLIRHIHSSHQNEFKNSQTKYLSLAIKIASPVVQRGLDAMKSQTDRLQDYQIMLDPRLAEILDDKITEIKQKQKLNIIRPWCQLSTSARLMWKTNQFEIRRHA